VKKEVEGNLHVALPRPFDQNDSQAKASYFNPRPGPCFILVDLLTAILTIYFSARTGRGLVCMVGYRFKEGNSCDKNIKLHNGVKVLQCS
jgi:hypothetical protein